ncbi:MAG: hypothetical protein EZS28_029368 [Streblomastix strix]|uniref:Uncharacterized protein n=1 Tax=Streblomastix strix TaxID=222440 RepID=A0A5J4UWM6_9EUKA|nr:MAG: hypothetical protein EZS28_029368 [Streblomastix strix]
MIAGISCPLAYQIPLSTVHLLTCQCCVMAFPGDLKVMQQRNYLILVAKWNVIQFQVLNKGEVVEYDIYTPQLPNLKLYRYASIQFFTLVPTLCGSPGNAITQH